MMRNGRDCAIAARRFRCMVAGCSFGRFRPFLNADLKNVAIDSRLFCL